VNTRTVRRYITMLQDLGFPIEAERGRHGFYYLRPGFKLPPLMFTEEEALALTLGLLAVRHLGLTVAAPAVEGALAKIERVLPQMLRERVRAVQETLSLTFPPYTINTSSEILLTLCTAAQLERRVFLNYQTWDSKGSEREADIYGLVYRGGYWYSVGYCHLRQDLRIFRLDRITNVEMREEIFTRPLDFDCVDYVMHALSNTPTTWPVEILLETTLAEAQQVILPAVAGLEATEQGVMMRCSVGNLDWLAESILTRLEWPFIVIQPPELREKLHKLAARLEVMAARSLPSA
jgi:predicted DNA-binding transcriptional regulator YafY